ncbi:helicase [Saccharopolyspora gloriosae]|uniref:helicase n=1 Tax=Saccharopolyspora gloriosae TaxID=455344 RepID=UPI001FB641EE|nr:helicase [Saccharopolyspora gloriosae]
MSKNAELSEERECVAFLHGRLDAERAAAAAALADALMQSVSPETAWQRDVSVAAGRARVARANVAAGGLCFGRIDGADSRMHIGRIGLFDEDHGHEPLLLDWRAPAARPFYCATAANPEGLVRRRHLSLSGRQVTDFHDEFFDGTDDPGSALLAAMNAPREPAMRDIVATVQAEQDEIIRLDRAGVVVLEGGPGTGKTAVALHRIAYLLYTQRERLSRRGVLMLGPNPAFLRYIGTVLPSLGETDVVFATAGALFPGVRADVEDSPAAQRIKGDGAMVEVLAAAVADRQETPARPIEIGLSDVTVPLDHELADAARERARASGALHNAANEVFGEALLHGIADRAVDLIGDGWLEDEDVALRADLLADVRFELSGNAEFRRAVDSLWPVLTPQRLLADLFGSRRRLRAACSSLSEQDREELFRADGAAWTVSDVALLDEAVEFLGPQVSVGAQQERARRERTDYAREVLAAQDWDDEDGETLRAADVIDAAELAERQEERDHRPLAERAAADRDWTYGNLVVDEAQELSTMDWRMLMRRCPGKAITAVGDLAQRRSPAGARSWREAFEPHVRERWTHRELTTNYRTPAEIMDVAAAVLAAADPDARPPLSIRRSGHPPWSRKVEPAGLRAALHEIAESEAAQPGTFAVISPVPLDLPGHTVLTPGAAKGLEFDSVVLAEPHRIADGPRGGAELYVALTRATQRLGIVHTARLPAPIRESGGVVGDVG